MLRNIIIIRNRDLIRMAFWIVSRGICGKYVCTRRAGVGGDLYNDDTLRSYLKYMYLHTPRKQKQIVYIYIYFLFRL